MGRIGVVGDVRVFIAYLISIACMTGLLFLGRSKNRGLVCAVCAISSLCFYIVQSFDIIQKNQTVPLFIAIGLAIALISSIVKTNALEQWIADFFVLSIPVMIVYDALFVPLFSFLNLDTGLLAPWIDISKTSLFMDVGFLNWPVLVWGVIVTAAAFLPAIYFITSKTKGK